MNNTVQLFVYSGLLCGPDSSGETAGPASDPPLRRRGHGGTSLLSHLPSLPGTHRSRPLVFLPQPLGAQTDPSVCMGKSFIRPQSFIALYAFYYSNSLCVSLLVFEVSQQQTEQSHAFIQAVSWTRKRAVALYESDFWVTTVRTSFQNGLNCTLPFTFGVFCIFLFSTSDDLNWPKVTENTCIINVTKYLFQIFYFLNNLNFLLTFIRAAQLWIN